MRGLVRAPEIQRDGLVWFNVDAPLSLSVLRGRLVILDFWTFCCINCMHVLPALRRLEDAFPRDLTVIGVHSPKFPAERDPANVAHAIQRYGITHPVVHDQEMTLWREYCVRAWPTLVLIAPDGHVVGALAGEPDPDRLVEGVGEMIRSYRDGGMMRPIALPCAVVPDHGGTLRFPGKVKPVRGPRGERWWAVADAGQHQVAVFDDAGTERHRFGKGRPGLLDCGAECCLFNAPQGLAGGDGVLHVADTGNHVIRRIDLASGQVSTVAGTGARGAPLDGEPTPAAQTALASVWDLEADGERLFFANAGTHQIGVIDLGRGTARRLAGTGEEDLRDGPADGAALAQPSGLALDAAARTLYFVDSETSAVRALRLGDAPRVETLAGAGLFDFGDADGPFATARFQHPLGIAAGGDGRLYVADSYNGVVRVLDLATRAVTRLGEAEYRNDDGLCLPAGEPAGIAVAGGGRFLLSDTNNHRIVELWPAERRLRTWVG